MGSLRPLQYPVSHYTAVLFDVPPSAVPGMPGRASSRPPGWVSGPGPLSRRPQGGLHLQWLWFVFAAFQFVS